MKRHWEASNTWLKLKALEYFVNFLRNQRGWIDDDDFFNLVSELLPPEEWKKRICASFSADQIRWLQDRSHSSGLHGRTLDFSDSPQEQFCAIWNNQTAFRSRLRNLFAKVVSEYRAEHPLEKFACEVFPRKVDELRSTLKLSEVETEIVLVFVLFHSEILYSPDRHRWHNSTRDKAELVAQCLDCDTPSILNSLSESGKLRRFGCIDEDLDFNDVVFNFLNGMSDEPLSSRYFKRDKEESLPWEFYGELAEKHGVLLKSLICAGQGKSGMNVLFYGAPGTGKTSFARSLAAELKRDCFQIAQRDKKDSGEGGVSPAFRFAAVQICDSQVNASRSLMIVDEADNMLCGGGGSMEFLFSRSGGKSSRCGDKGLLNSVLDAIKTPTIWISNAPAEDLDESSRRRFDYSIKFEPLSSTQRLRIWKNSVAKWKLNKLFDDGMLESLSERYAVSAGGIAQVLQNVAKLAPRKAEVTELVHKLLAPHCELMGISAAPPKFIPAKDYSLEGLNIKGGIPQERIVAAIRNFLNDTSGGLDRPRMNLLLSGPPGTGKTEFVKYLGGLLQRKVEVAMGSDLLSMFVGGTERNIKQAFARAEAERSILFLDEIDGLVQNRERSQHSWEVTQVNELLHQMENFNGIMIGATNFAANLDAAILRRFTFKLEFDYLTEAGKLLFFERMFQTKLTESEKEELMAIPHLAPGDFRTVRQALYYLGGTVTNAERIAELKRESLLKKQNRFALQSKLGF